MILQSHLFSMVLYAVFVCVVLALIRRNDRRSQIKYAVTLFLIMVAGAVVFGFFMSLFIL